MAWRITICQIIILLLLHLTTNTVTDLNKRRVVSRKVYILYAFFFVSLLSLSQNPDGSDQQTFADHWEYIGIAVGPNHRGSD